MQIHFLGFQEASEIGGDATDVVFVREAELADYSLPPHTLRVLRKGFGMARARGAA